ncbi:hypothetical protein BH23CHL7_BH23CHL7_00130 [soil metagenome]
MTGRLPAGTTSRGELLRGLRNGLLVALVLFVLVGGAVAALTFGRPVLFGTTLELSGALALGALAGSIVAIGYFAFGTVVLLVGLLRRPSPRWMTRDAWLVAPVVAVLVVAAWGFAAGLGEYADRPITRAGTVNLAVAGPDFGQADAQGQAQCILHDGTDLVVRAGTAGGEAAVTTLETEDGVVLGIQLALPGAAASGLQLDIGGRSAWAGKSVDARLDTAPGANRFGGTLHFSGLAPLDPRTGEPEPGEGWRGTLTWACQF